MAGTLPRQTGLVADSTGFNDSMNSDTAVSAWAVSRVFIAPLVTVTKTSTLSRRHDTTGSVGLQTRPEEQNTELFGEGPATAGAAQASSTTRSILCPRTRCPQHLPPPLTAWAFSDVSSASRCAKISSSGKKFREIARWMRLTKPLPRLSCGL